MSRMHPGHDLNSALDLVSDAVLARLDGPPEKIRGLPNETFTSQAFFELEQQTLFPRCWNFAGVASEQPEVGDVRPKRAALGLLVRMKRVICIARPSRSHRRGSAWIGRGAYRTR